MTSGARRAENARVDMVLSVMDGVDGRNVDLGGQINDEELTMLALSPRAQRLVVTALATTALAGALAPTVTEALAAPSAAVATSGSSCVDGVVPLNPYVVNCNLPARGTHIAGAAPDAGAIIACRHNLTCLSYYVNYPGTLVVPGYRP